MIGEDVDPHSYILHLSEFNALICRTCQHGMTGKGVARHFQRHHKSIPYAIRKRLVSFASGLLISNSDEIILPSVEIEAIDGLEVIEGFACQECVGLYGTLESIRQHCRKKHGWVKLQGIDSTLKRTDLNRTDVAGPEVADVL
jgi:Orsellinic acid/F9775 biosynthesis cluster protein D